jgi:CHAD domain-containing protein
MAAYREREVKLEVPPDFQLPDLGGLGAGVAVSSATERRFDTVYWDTEDLRLIRWGCTLRHRDGEGWTVKLPRHEEGALLVRDEHHFDGDPASPPVDALDLLLAFVRTATVAPVARLRTVRRVVTVLGAGGRPVLEIDDDDVTVLDGERPTDRFREVELELVDSPNGVLDGILTRLRRAGARRADPTPKLIRALGARAIEPPEVVVEPLTRSAATGAAVRHAIAASVARLMLHDPGVRLGVDPEDVHQARVATRRLRSDLRTFAPLLDRSWADALRDELRWLAGDLGAVRDAEVLRERLMATASRLPEADREAGRRVAARLDEAVSAARQRLLTTMREPRYVALLDRLVEAGRSPALGPDTERRARDVLPRLVRRPWKRLRRDARRLDESSPDEQLHALRIRAKRCRYAAEAVAPVVAGRAAGFAKAVAALQDVLGEQHDAVVAAEWLHEHAAARPDAFTAGQLWCLEREAAQAAREAWRRAWRRVDRRRLRSWM